MRDVETGMEQGRTSGAGSNDSDGGTSTAPATALSHTRRRSLTTHLTTKRHFSKRHPTTPSGTRDQQAVPQHTPFGEHAPCAEALWKTRRRVIVPIPFRRHKTPIHTDLTSKESVASSIPQHTTRDIRTTHSSSLLQANGQTRPSDVIDRVSRVVCRPKITRESKRVGGC
mgnify:CR=1 FL=1